MLAFQVPCPIHRMFVGKLGAHLNSFSLLKLILGWWQGIPPMGSLHSHKPYPSTSGYLSWRRSLLRQRFRWHQHVAGAPRNTAGRWGRQVVFTMLLGRDFPSSQACNRGVLRMIKGSIWAICSCHISFDASWIISLEKMAM